jgi:hypothetical protein
LTDFKGGAMSEAFVPGWLPTGWKRGDRLQVINRNFRHGPVMALQNVQPTMSPCIGGDGSAYMQDMVMAKFHEANRGKVLAWLRWFCFTEDYPDLAGQI